MTIFFLVFLIGDHLFEVIPYHIRGGSRGRVQGVCTPPLPEMTCGFLIQLVFCEKKNYVVCSCRRRARDECTPS